MANKLKSPRADKINPNELPTRDWLLLLLINGATKSSVAKDQKKERNRQKCRGRQDLED